MPSLNYLSPIAGNKNSYITEYGKNALNNGLKAPFGIWHDTNGNLFYNEFFDNTANKITSDGNIELVGGNGTQSLDGPFTSRGLQTPFGICSDPSGKYLYFSADSMIWKYDTTTGLASFYGGKCCGFANGPVRTALFSIVRGISADTNGNLYVADYLNSLVRKIDSNEIVSTVAGKYDASRVGGFGSGLRGDGGPATLAYMRNPMDVFVNTIGVLYIADFNNFRIRAVDLNTGIITTFAGGNNAGACCAGFGAFGYGGDGGPATSAGIGTIRAVKGDSMGNIYIGDSDNCVVRKVDINGIITRFAGSSIPADCGLSYGSGLATATTLGYVTGLHVSDDGNVYISHIKRLDQNPTYGMISLATAVPADSPSFAPLKNPTVRPSRIPTSIEQTQLPTGFGNITDAGSHNSPSSYSSSYSSEKILEISAITGGIFGLIAICLIFYCCIFSRKKYPITTTNSERDLQFSKSESVPVSSLACDNMPTAPVQAELRPPREVIYYASSSEQTVFEKSDVIAIPANEYTLGDESMPPTAPAAVIDYERAWNIIRPDQRAFAVSDSDLSSFGHLLEELGIHNLEDFDGLNKKYLERIAEFLKPAKEKNFRSFLGLEEV